MGAANSADGPQMLSGFTQLMEVSTVVREAAGNVANRLNADVILYNGPLIRRLGWSSCPTGD